MSHHKIQSHFALLKKLNIMKQQGKKIVFVRGCFDLLHPGHLYYLRCAKKLGDILVVWLNTDQSVRRLKGAGRPIWGEQERLFMLASLEFVDFVSLFDHQQSLALIQKFKPDFVAAARISSPYRETIAEYGGKIKLIPVLKKYSTTKIIKKILESRSQAVYQSSSH